jgi:hypothetical protein
MSNSIKFYTRGNGPLYHMINGRHTPIYHAPGIFGNRKTYYECSDLHNIIINCVIDTFNKEDYPNRTIEIKHVELGGSSQARNTKKSLYIINMIERNYEVHVKISDEYEHLEIYSEHDNKLNCDLDIINIHNIKEYVDRLFKTKRGRRHRSQN